MIVHLYSVVMFMMSPTCESKVWSFSLDFDTNICGQNSHGNFSSITFFLIFAAETLEGSKMVFLFIFLFRVPSLALNLDFSFGAFLGDLLIFYKNSTVSIKIRSILASEKTLSLPSNKARSELCALTANTYT